MDVTSLKQLLFEVFHIQKRGTSSAEALAIDYFSHERREIQFVDQPFPKTVTNAAVDNVTSDVGKLSPLLTGVSFCDAILCCVDFNAGFTFA